MYIYIERERERGREREIDTCEYMCTYGGSEAPGTHPSAGRWEAAPCRPRGIIIIITLIIVTMIVPVFTITCNSSSSKCK